MNEEQSVYSQAATLKQTTLNVILQSYCVNHYNVHHMDDLETRKLIAMQWLGYTFPKFFSNIVVIYMGFLCPACCQLHDELMSIIEICNC